MSDIRLFRLGANGVEALPSSSVAVEKSLQSLIEQHLETFLGVRFLASEHATGKAHGGRIDTLGIDENNCPVIIEYKRALNENVINQGLFYLNWLMDHKAEFELLVLKNLGATTADAIEWKQPRLLCIAGDFTKYDEHAIQEIPRNIELIRYRRYGEELLLLELASATSGQQGTGAKATPGPGKLQPVVVVDGSETPVRQRYHKCSVETKDRYERIRSSLLAFGDEVQERELDRYIAFRRMRNFAYVRFRPQTERIVVGVYVSPSEVALEPGFTRPERPNDPEYPVLLIDIRSDDDLDRAMPLIRKSYEAS